MFLPKKKILDPKSSDSSGTTITIADRNPHLDVDTRILINIQTKRELKEICPQAETALKSALLQIQKVGK